MGCLLLFITVHHTPLITKLFVGGLNLFIGVVPLGPNTSKSSISQHLYIGDLVSKTDFISPAGDCACKHMSDHIGAFVFKPPHALRHINSYRELTGFQGQF